MGQDTLFVAGYPGHDLGQGVGRGFKQSSGGGVAVLTLPYLYTFDNETVGQAPAGWENVGSAGIIAPVVANSAADRNSYNPNRKCMHLNTDVDNSVSTIFRLPGVVDVSAGIRIAMWWRGEVSAQVYIKGGLLGEDHQTQPGLNGITLEHRNDVGQQCQCGGIINGVAQTNINCGNTAAKGDEWVKWQAEYNPAAATKVSGAVRRQQNDWHLLTVSSSPSWIPTLASNWLIADRFWFWDYKQVNVYCRDSWVMGFWIGRTTDAFPSHQMPVPG